MLCGSRARHGGKLAIAKPKSDDPVTEATGTQTNYYYVTTAYYLT